MLIIICFVLQAVSYEFRSKPNNLLGRHLYESFLLFNGFAGTILIGVVLGTFFNGAVFSINDLNISRWETPYHGLEAALRPHNLLLGLSIFFLTRVLALLFFLKNISHEQIVTRSKIRLLRNFVTFLFFFIIFITLLMRKDGFSYDPVTQFVDMEPNKYLNNFFAMPVVLAMKLFGIVLVLFGIIRSLLGRRFTRGIWYSGLGTVLAVMSLFLIAGFNNTCYYPSLYDFQDSLTIENSSSSQYTLVIMSYVSLIIPFVALYIIWTWSVLSKKQITVEELKEDIYSY